MVRIATVSTEATLHLCEAEPEDLRLSRVALVAPSEPDRFVCVEIDLGDGTRLKAYITDPAALRRLSDLHREAADRAEALLAPAAEPALAGVR